MVTSKKISSASSSAKARSKETAAAVNISKSTKENATTVTKATMPSSATKKTTASNKLERKPAAKPLQAHTPLSQGLNDAEIAALLAKVTAQEGLFNFVFG
jgi:spore germination cell wall hydrolase CwlJ-like protein